MASKITRTIKFTRLEVATIDRATKTVQELEPIIIDGHVPLDKLQKHTKDVILGHTYECAMYEMDTATFIKNSRKLSDEEVAKINAARETATAQNKA